VATRRRDAVSLESPGYFRVRKGGEYHGKGKEVVDALAPFAVATAAPDDGPDTMMTAAHLLQRAIKGDSTPTYDAYAAS
jgi:hypothetical protein